MRVYKLVSSYKLRQIVLYRQGKTKMLGRVVGVNETGDKLIVARNNEDDQTIQFADVIGRVILNTR